MTTQQGLRLATGVVVENMGTTVLVMIPGQHDVLTLTGPAADVVSAVVAGQPVSKDLEPEVELLLSTGVLTSPMSRRNLLRAGAIGAGAGIAVLSMPSVAAAASPGGGTSGGVGDDDEPPAGITISRGSAVGGNVPFFEITFNSPTHSAFAVGTTANIRVFRDSPSVNTAWNGVVVESNLRSFRREGPHPEDWFVGGNRASWEITVGGQTYSWQF